MDLLAQKKLAEAKELVASAEKSLKTSFFKRTPEYALAADAYNKAAMCCKVAKDFEKSFEYFNKSGECYVNIKQLFSAAKQYEQAAFVANELKKYDVAYEYMSKAAENFITNGNRDSATILLEKGANMIKMYSPENALKLYARAIDIADVEDRNHDLYTLYENSVALTLKLKKFTESIEFFKKCLEVLEKIGKLEQMTKHLLSLVIIYLSKDDWVSASNEVNRLRDRYGLNETQAFSQVDEIIAAYDEKDEDTFNLKLKNYLSYAVDNEILKLAYTIPKNGEWYKIAKPSNQIKEVNQVMNQLDLNEDEGTEDAEQEEENFEQNDAEPQPAKETSNEAQNQDEDDESLL